MSLGVEKRSRQTVSHGSQSQLTESKADLILSRRLTNFCCLGPAHRHHSPDPPFCSYEPAFFLTGTCNLIIKLSP